MLSAYAGYMPALIGTLRPPAAVKAIFIAPAAAGDASGSSWANAAAIDQLSNLIAIAAVTGAEIRLRADAGEYALPGTLNITKGGANAASAVRVRGTDVNGLPMKAVLRGNRANPWAPGRANGTSSGNLLLLAGASHLFFSHLDFRDQGNGCIRVGADIANLRIEDVTATNVRTFFENTVSGLNKSAAITGLTIRRCEGHGYSKRFARVQYDSSGILIEDCLGDSERQDGDNFASGIAFGGTAHGAVINRTVMRNHIDTLHRYQNGDGFAGERGNYDIELNDCGSYNNTDGGYDFKGDNVRFNRCIGQGNHRNFRCWGLQVLTDCQSIEPIDNAGTNPYAQGHFCAFQNGMVRLYHCSAVAPNSKADVYHVETGGIMSISASCTVNAPKASRIRFTEAANAGDQAGQITDMPTDGAVPTISYPPTTQSIDENKGAVWVLATSRPAMIRITGGADRLQFAINGPTLLMRRQDYDTNPAPRVVEYQVMDGAGIWSATRTLTVGIGDVADDPIGRSDIFAASGASGGATNGLWITFDGSCPMWQDADGRIPAVIDQPVARVDDISGNGINIVVVDETAAPYLRSNGIYQWLEHSGLEIWKIGGAGALRYPQLTAFAVCRRDKDDTSAMMLFSVPRSASNPSFNEVWSLGFTGGASMTMRLNPTNYTSAGTGGTVGKDIVASLRSTTATARSNAGGILDGTDVASLTYPVSGIARLCADGNAGKTFNGRLYGLVVTNRAETDEFVFRIERQLGQLAGLNL